jgi:hypothetical protein
MFVLAITLGLYAYSIFVLGIFGLLTKEIGLIDTALFTGIYVLFLWRNRNSLATLLQYRKKLTKFYFFLLLLIVFQVIVNLVGVLGPELAFDALWYHLTLPKIYLTHGAIAYIPGNLLYYSAMPQLTEMFYISALAFSGEVLAKFIHFLFGILTCIALYLFAFTVLKKQLPSLLAVALFYANLVVGWESIAAYSDLSLSFFTLMSLFAFYKWIEKKKLFWLVISAVLVGFAIGTKLLAIGTLGIMLCLIIYELFYTKVPITTLCKHVALYAFVAILVASPWLMYAFINTGNPLYPFFSHINPVEGSYITFDPLRIVPDVWRLFVVSDDPILPLYLMLIPLIFVMRKKLQHRHKCLIFYSFLALLFWFVLPKIGGGRFLLPYLPAYSLLASYIIFAISNKFLRKLLIAIAILLFLTSIGYRGLANARYVPLLVGYQTKEQFLRENLNFNFGDFYDIDGYFGRRLTHRDTVLLYGFHNLYYVNFPFIDASYIKKGDRYNFIAVQGGELPLKHTGAKLVYKNPITHVSLYNLGRYEIHE